MNRMTIGINIDNMYNLGIDVFDMGWSDRIPDPCAVEKPPGSSAELEFNVVLVESSEGRLPKVDLHRMVNFAMSCNNTVWFLKCALAGMPFDHPKMSLGGRLSLSVIEETDPTFAKRIREGMYWTVLDWRVQKYYPEILEMISIAKNLPGEINRRTSCFEVCQQIFNLSQTMKDSDGFPDWSRVKRAVERNRPTCYGMLTELSEFAIARSGGTSGIFLRETIG